MRFEKILVLTDFSENAQRAFERACDLAAQLGASLHCLHVQEETTLRTAVREGMLRDGSTDEELKAAVEQLISERFSAMRAGVGDAGVPIECVKRRGDPKVEAVEYATEIEADLIVMGRRGISLIERVVVGSVADFVIRKAPCPVMVVRREHG